MSLLDSILGRQPTAIPPQVDPEYRAHWDALTPWEQGELLRLSEASAKRSLQINPSRNFIAERDAYINLELSGTLARVAAVVEENLWGPSS